MASIRRCTRPRCRAGMPGILHGNRTYLLQNEDGQIIDAHSISAGLDYPGIGPEHAFLHETGRATYRTCTDKEALDAFQLCTRLEGIIPALEPAHALARVGDIAKELGQGRADRDEHVRARRQGHLLGRRRIWGWRSRGGTEFASSDAYFDARRRRRPTCAPR